MKKGEIYLVKDIKLMPELEPSVRPMLVIKEDGKAIPLTSKKSGEALNVNFEPQYPIYLMKGYVVTLSPENIIYKLGELIEN